MYHSGHQGFDGKARRKKTTWKTKARPMDLREIGWRSVEWTQMTQDRDRRQALTKTAMNLRVLAPQS
jgi:hypothetical protein